MKHNYVMVDNYFMRCTKCHRALAGNSWHNDITDCECVKCIEKRLFRIRHNGLLEGEYD